MKILFPILTILVLWVIWLAYPLYSAFKKTVKIEEKTVAYERRLEHPTMKILVAGDSTVVGVGSVDPKLSTAGRLASKYPNADVENLSENGLKISGLIQKMQALPNDFHYDLILIQIGANDITMLTPIKDVRFDINSLLNLAESKSSQVVILHSGNIGLSPVFHFPLNVYMSYRTRKVRDIYINEVNNIKHVAYVDLYRERVDDIFSKDINKYYAGDLFHPTADAYGVWFDEIVKVLEKK